MPTGQDISKIFGEIVPALYLSSVAAVSFYSLSLTFLNECANRFSRKILSQNELEKEMIKEAKRLKLDHKKINIGTISKKELSRVSQLEDGIYLIRLAEDNMTMALLRHELYHIKSADLSKANGLDLKYFLIHEPQAIIYSICGLQL